MWLHKVKGSLNEKRDLRDGDCFFLLNFQCLEPCLSLIKPQLASQTKPGSVSWSYHHFDFNYVYWWLQIFPSKQGKNCTYQARIIRNWRRGKKENCLQVLCVFVGFSVLMLCAFLGLLLIIALGGLIGQASLGNSWTWSCQLQSTIQNEFYRSLVLY